MLFASADEERWGTMTAEGIEIHESAWPGDEDFLDRAVVEAIATGARMHVLPGEVPPVSPIAAILRY